VYGRLGLIAFGANEAPSPPLKLRIPMMALPSWEKIWLEQLCGIHLRNKNRYEKHFL